MREVEYEKDGKKYLVRLPEGVEDVSLGIPIGPPDFTEALGIPEPFATRLHNQMFNRRMFSLKDVRKRSKELQAAIQSAIRLDAALIINAYHEAEKESSTF